MNKNGPKPLTTQPTMTLTYLMDHFRTEEDCKTFLRDRRWPDGVRCPRCGNEKVYTLKQPFKWQCQSEKCGKKGYRFSVTAGTIFENTKYPLRTWFQVAYLMMQSKKGMSALQVHRQIKSGSYETAWFMCHRLRAAMRAGNFDKLTGEVEVDETFIGGKNKNRHLSIRRKLAGRGAVGKIPVIGAVSRRGNVVARVIQNTDKPTLDQFVREAVSQRVSLLATDEHPGYGDLDRDFPHGVVRHSQSEYVVGAIHTNNIENFWSLLKRGIVGTYHKVSKKYLPLYVDEFAFRYNNRDNPAIFEQVLAASGN
jgi:transposase-like protein